MKKCSKCLVVKEVKWFGICKRSKDGLQSVCKNCRKQYIINHKDKIKQYKKQYYINHKDKIKQYQINHKEEIKQDRIKYRHSVPGLIKKIYLSQKHSSVKRNHHQPDYSEKWLYDFIMDDSKFKILYNQWVESSYNKKLTPSIDRIDNSLPYLKDNLQLMTWEDNRSKGYIERSKKVYQYTKNGQFIAQFKSAREAERITGISNRNISSCCNNKNKSAGGFIWKFA